LHFRDIVTAALLLITKRERGADAPLHRPTLFEGRGGREAAGGEGRRGTPGESEGVGVDLRLEEDCGRGWRRRRLHAPPPFNEVLAIPGREVGGEEPQPHGRGVQGCDRPLGAQGAAPWSDGEGDGYSTSWGGDLNSCADQGGRFLT